MPATLSYPGVYIEEVPSGVRAITGVATSIAAFVGYTRRGPLDTAVEIFSFADFERQFGGLDMDSELSYAVRHFFLNGGSHAWIVRVADGAASASVKILDEFASPSLTITAKTAGTWGNNLHVVVDYDTSSPGSFFNLSIAEIVANNGLQTRARSEVHRNLSMNSTAPNFVETVVNADSSLVSVTRDPGFAPNNMATSESGKIDPADLPLNPANHKWIMISVNNDPPRLIDITAGPNAPNTVPNIAENIEKEVQAVYGPKFTCVEKPPANSNIIRASWTDVADDKWSVRFLNAPSNNAAGILRLGVTNGGREVESAAQTRPAPSGTVGEELPTFTPADISALNALVKQGVEVIDSSDTAEQVPAVTLWDTGLGDSPPASYDELATMLENALRTSAHPALAGARVALIDNRFVVVGSGDNTVRLEFPKTGAEAKTVTEIMQIDDSNANVTANLAAYRLGQNLTKAAQVADALGSDGTPPASSTAYEGSRADKTGLYALEDVDLFTILTIPQPTISDTELTALWSVAVAYAEERRSFAIIDLPPGTDDVSKAKVWLTKNGTLFHRNAAAYFPRIMAADPLRGNRIRAMPNSGLMAGLYSRTDSTRGVWKAPAGTDAMLRGVMGLEYVLTDPENGVLNPRGLNSLRVLPGIGPVAWGARTLDGADIRASEWKYVPVRRLALFLEESLYRGTQWVVFEPNDEPLWAQIRLNVGAFMHRLFRQGAFQGTSPRDAYLVKCDRETTTQADIDLGIVNILVGFAPLKPAEFVVIKIQQLAGQTQV